jgi:hypothetical protein
MEGQAAILERSGGSNPKTHDRNLLETRPDRWQSASEGMAE